MPHLRRGQEFVTKAGDVIAVRLQRSTRDKSGTWSWKHNPFKGSREFNGLRVMALISNWDLKDENNAIYVDEKTPDRRFYEVSDLGSSFGMSGKSYTDALAKNNPRAYKRTKFVSKVTAEYVDFNFPSCSPVFVYLQPTLLYRKNPYTLDRKAHSTQ